MQAQQEGLHLVALNKLQRVIGKDIVGKALHLLVLAFHLQRGVGHLVAAGAEAHEIIEPRLGGMKLVRHAKVPFTDQPRVVAGLLHGFSPSHCLGVQPEVGFAAWMNPVPDAQLAAVSAGHESRTRGTANGRDHVRLLEPHPLLEELIEVGCIGVRMAGEAQCPRRLIVGEDKYHVGPLLLRRCQREHQRD